LIPDYLHTLTLPTPFPVGPVNTYLALSNEPTLVDTGPNDPATLAALNDQLAQRGLALKDIRRVIVTHAHVDHFGIAPLIVAASGAKIFSHARNRAWLTDFDHEWDRRRDFYRAVFAASGAPPELAQGIGQSAERMMSRYGSSIPSENYAEIAEGDAIVLGGNRDAWRVLFTPGHAGGLICLFEPNSGTLLSNDHLIRDITSNPILESPAPGERERPRALVNYLASMERTAAMDVRIALPGHGEPVTDVRALVAHRVAFHRARCSAIEAQLERGPATAFELMNVMFPNLKSFDVFLGLSEVIGHLDILEEEKRIARETRADVIRYAKA
jgi:glyoxylase-like metal-dependent hydrolase (beta-lactamase superfamily II)